MLPPGNETGRASPVLRPPRRVGYSGAGEQRLAALLNEVLAAPPDL
jgi:hypothetical protein